MSLLYSKQAYRLLQENRFLSIISILGTALSIAMIMVVVILFRAKTADTIPEVNRSRSLYVKLATARSGKGSMNMARLSVLDVKEVFYPLTTPEVVTAVYGGGRSHASIPGGTESVDYRTLYTDAAF
ncbi:MAG: hypothetical protein LUD15_04390 [Bacteroides sp.]|nr:hypothetical protein [Bacteroides sp.]